MTLGYGQNKASSKFNVPQKQEVPGELKFYFASLVGCCCCCCCGAGCSILSQFTGFAREPGDPRYKLEKEEEGEGEEEEGEGKGEENRSCNW